MKIITKTITTYEAFDGTVFNTLDECDTYEKSKLPLYKRIVIEQGFVWYEKDRNELHVYGDEDEADVTDDVKMYTCRIIHDTLEMQKQGKTQVEILLEFGLY